MISIKAATILGLAGLGASALGTGAYVESRGNATSPAKNIDAITVFRETPINVDPAYVEEAMVAVDDSVVTLDPVTIYGRIRAARSVPKPRELLPCSSWQELESGPSGRRVKELCLRAAN